MKAGALVQARMGSRRLPGKVLADLGGRPLLAHVISRLRRCRTLGVVAVATSDRPADDAIEAFCGAHGVPCFRGSEPDVLGRLAAATRHLALDPVVRITADCPFVCPETVDRLVSALVESGADHARLDAPTLHAGIDPFSARWLLAMDARPHTDDAREHVLPDERTDARTTRIVHVPADPAHAAHAGVRLCVDDAADLAFARTLVAELGGGMRDFPTAELVGLLAARPELARAGRREAPKKLERSHAPD